MAHIRRHPVDRSKWQVRYRDPTNKERSKTFNRKADAEDFLIRVEAGKRTGEWVNPDLAATRLDDWADRWLATRVNLKPKTYADYESLLRIHVLPRFGHTRLDTITPITVDEWIADLTASGLSASRTRKAHQVLHSMLEYAVKNRHLPSNPAANARLPRLPKREMLFLDAVEVERLADAAGPHHRALILTLAHGGLRWAEAVGLTRRRIDILHRRIDIVHTLSEVGGTLHPGTTKNHRARTITIPGFLRDELNEHLVTRVGPEPDALVFPAPRTGTPLRNSNFTKQIWVPAKAQAEVDTNLRIHDLRHTCAALMIAAGAHPEKIKRHMGHSSITVTMDLYGHLLPSEDEALADRLDQQHRQALADNRRTRTV